MNTVTLIGNLTRDPEMTNPNGNTICKFSIAVNDGYGENQTTNYIPIVVFGKQAESCSKYLSKGRKVGVTGRIKTGSYERDGRKVYTTDIIAQSVEFLNSDKNIENANKPRENESQRLPQHNGGGFAYLDEEDPPF